MAEALCPRHGPYDAALGSCPYCARSGRGARPGPPQPLGDEETGARPRGGGVGDDEETLWRDRRPLPESDDDDDVTQFGRRGRGAAGDDLEDRTEPLHEKKGLLGWLIVTDGPRRGHIYPIQHGATIGKNKMNATVVIADDKVSGLHAKVTVEEGQFVLWDFGSTNGTFVNGRRIREATKLSENDRIQVGATRLILKTLPEEVPSE